MSILYHLILRLYPIENRARFRAEMTLVLNDAAADAGRCGMAKRLCFHVRELFGLIGDCVRAHIEAVGSNPESWVCSLETPVLVVLLYSFWLGQMHEMGVHGFFFPGTHAVVGILGVLAVRIVARRCRVITRRRHLRQTLAVVLLCAMAIPVAAKITEEMWVRYLTGRADSFHYQIPGLDVIVRSGQLGRGDFASSRRGLTFSRNVDLPNGGAMVLLHHTDEDAPSYELFVGVLAAALAFWSRRGAPHERAILRT